MPQVYVTGVVEVVIRAERDGSERLNVWHYRHPAGTVSTQAELEDLIDGIVFQIDNNLKHTSAAGTTWREVVATDISAPNGPQASRSISYAGDGGAQVFPANVAVVASKRTGFSGRSRRGRHYFFDLPEDFLNGSTVNPIYQGTLQDAAEALAQPQMPVGYIPVVLSPTLADTADITSIVLNPIAATQRRRLPNHGS